MCCQTKPIWTSSKLTGWNFESVRKTDLVSSNTKSWLGSLGFQNCFLFFVHLTSGTNRFQQCHMFKLHCSTWVSNLEGSRFSEFKPEMKKTGFSIRERTQTLDQLLWQLTDPICLLAVFQYVKFLSDSTSAKAEQLLCFFIHTGNAKAHV